MDLYCRHGVWRKRFFIENMVLNAHRLPGSLCDSIMQDFEVVIIEPFTEKFVRYTEGQTIFIQLQGFKRCKPGLETSGIDIFADDLKAFLPNILRRICDTFGTAEHVQLIYLLFTYPQSKIACKICLKP